MESCIYTTDLDCYKHRNHNVSIDIWRETFETHTRTHTLADGIMGTFHGGRLRSFFKISEVVMAHFSCGAVRVMQGNLQSLLCEYIHKILLNGRSVCVLVMSSALAVCIAVWPY